MPKRTTTEGQIVIDTVNKVVTRTDATVVTWTLKEFVAENTGVQSDAQATKAVATAWSPIAAQAATLLQAQQASPAQSQVSTTPTPA